MAPMMDFLGNNVTQPVYDSGTFVISEMVLAITSIVFNLMVMSAIREKESMLSLTYNLVLGNLCVANLLSAVLVKSISIVHHGHASAANSTESSSIAFCAIYMVSFRSTWAVLPWSIVLLAWSTVTHRLRAIKVNF